MPKQKLEHKISAAAATAFNRLNESAGSAAMPGVHQNDAPAPGADNNRRQPSGPALVAGRRAPRAALNFSIESIMQPNHNQVSSMLDNHYPVINQVSPAHSRSRSRSRSPASSSRASPASSEPSADGLSCASGSGRFELGLHQRRPVSRESSTRSGVSTPISPGGGLQCDADELVDEDDDDCCNTSESLRLSGPNAANTRTNSNGSSSAHQEVSSKLIDADNQIRMQQHQQQEQHQQQQQYQQQGQVNSRPQQQQRQSGGKGSRNNNQSQGGGGGSSNHLLRQPVCTDPRLAPFKCHLDNLDLWHRFHPLDTEMIITKQGRRMFPPVRVTFSLDDDSIAAINSQSQQQHQHQQRTTTAPGQPGPFQLNPRDKYQVLMDILPYDNKRYRYAYHKSSWQQAGKADPPSPTKLFLHPDGPFTLDQLKRQSVISFEKIKLTNNDANKHGYIVLNSMHKYQPRIHLALWRGKESSELANAPISRLDQEPHKTFIFSETIFTAVTAYQNHSITKLKIDSNPFAKGFRDSTRLTDLELESMQDLISDGQCPFSPPRAPPPGFPHFLFSAAAAAAAFGQPGGPQHPHAQLAHHQHHLQAGSGPMQPGEDPAAALLRERTIMALDSFLQQQQQQQQQQHMQSSSNSDSPNSHGPHRHQCESGATPLNSQQTRPPHTVAPPPQHPSSLTRSSSASQMLANSNGVGPQQPASQSSSSGPGAGHFSPYLAQSNAATTGGGTTAATSTLTTAGGGANQLAPPPTSQAGQMEQFIMQQQQQLAAAMAAAAAAAQHQHLTHPLQGLFAAQHQQQQADCGPQMAPASAASAGRPQPGAGAGCRSSPPRSGATTASSVGAAGQQQPYAMQLGAGCGDPTSPIGAAKSAARNQMLSAPCDPAALAALGFFASPLGGAQNPPGLSMGQPAGLANPGATIPTSLGPYGPFQAQAQAHLHALMMQHHHQQQQQQHQHQQQMATLPMQSYLQSAPTMVLNGVGADQSQHQHQVHQQQAALNASAGLRIQREKKSPGRV